MVNSLSLTFPSIKASNCKGKTISKVFRLKMELKKHTKDSLNSKYFSKINRRQVSFYLSSFVFHLSSFFISNLFPFQFQNLDLFSVWFPFPQNQHAHVRRYNRAGVHKCSL